MAINRKTLTNKKAKTMTISLSSEEYQALDKLSIEHERSRNYLIRKAIQNYLEDLHFYQKALEVLEKDEPNYSLREIAKKYGLSDKI